MPLYWVNSDIGSSKGNVKKHQFSSLSQFSEKTIKTLLDKKVIRVIEAPPVEVIPDFKIYATILKKKGIRTLMDVLVHRQTLHTVLNIDETEARSLASKAEALLRPDLPFDDG